MLSPTNNDDLAVPPKDLQFIQQVGSGGYGAVWKGKWRGKGGGVIVAIKKVPVIKLNPRQQREILIEFRHPNILTIFGACFFEEKELWIVMEYMEGGSLFEWLHSELEISWDVRLRLAQQAAISINVLHSSVPSVLHRDIKSLNFMVSLDGNILKLIDFGMSKVSSVTSQNVSTAPSEAIGTVRWGAPETFEYPPLWTSKADIYSLGITFYELATRKTPFEEIQDNDRVIFTVRTLKRRPELSPECPEGFSKIISECWHNEPAQRPTSLQLLEKLEAVIDSYTSSTAGTAPPDTLRAQSSETCSNTSSSAVLSTKSTTHSTALSTVHAVSSFNVAGRVTLRLTTPDFDSLLVSSGLDASLKGPEGVCMNPHDSCLYITDTGNNVVRKVTPQVAAGKLLIFAVDENIKGPRGIVMDHVKQLFYVTNTLSHKIVKITLSGTVSVFAGGDRGYTDGDGAHAQFNTPGGIAIDQHTSTLFVCDQGNCLIRKITPAGVVSTHAGGKENDATFNSPTGICYDPTNQSLLVCDSCLRRIEMNGTVTTLSNIPDSLGLVDIVITANGTIFVSSELKIIFRVTPKGSSYKATVLDLSNPLGTTTTGVVVGGKEYKTMLQLPAGMAVDELSNSCFVVDKKKNAIWKLAFHD